MATGGRTARFGEKKFFTQTCHNLRIRWPVADWCDRDATLHTIQQRYYYILTVIDVLSKHAWVVPLKTKNRNEMATTIAKIIRDDGRCPKNLQTNVGKEFYNANVQKLLKKHNINHSISSIMKTYVVERFNRMLKNDMWKQFTHNGNYKWIDLLLRLVSEYNARIICMRPIDVTLTIADKLLSTVYSSVKAIALATIQSGWFGTCDQIQDDLWERLHTKLNHGGI